MDQGGTVTNRSARRSAARASAVAFCLAATSVTLTTGVAEADVRNYVCSASSSASQLDSGGRDAIATSRDKTNSTRFFRVEFVAHDEVMYATNKSEFNSIEYRAHFEGTGKSWYWHLRPGNAISDNLDLPENHNVAINANPSVPGFNCGTNGGRT